MSQCTVRSYRPGDRESLISLWDRVFPDDPPRNAPDLMIENKLRVQSELLLVAEDDGSLVGAVIAGFDGTRGWMYHLAVAPERRSQGIGATLMRAAEDGLHEFGCPKINLQVRGTNEGVIAFYRSLGYDVEERVSLGKVLGVNSAPDG